MRYLHTMLRVRDLNAALDFYCNKLGLKEVRRRDDDKGRYTNVFLAAPDDPVSGGTDTGRGAPMVELTHNWGHEPYEMGSGFGHLAVGVPDVTGMCAEVTKAGGKVTRAPGPVKFGTTVIAFVEDPDGYKIELIERK